jgi:hypothetical protein
MNKESKKLTENLLYKIQITGPHDFSEWFYCSRVELENSSDMEIGKRIRQIFKVLKNREQNI